MADITRTITVEFTNTTKGSDGGKGYPNELKHVLERRLKEEFPLYDQIKVAKVQQFVFPDQPKAPKLTKKERALCEIVQNGWIARDNNKKLYWYKQKPLKGGATWYNDGQHVWIDLLNVPFMFITWEDDEPWAVEELLKLEVEE